ncbi:predicted protein [Streptomyces lividans TK24]|uniref:Uncharacterized protein n=1 Tax=Streptomyces lividans 1326 TaxID=1200984 RepID=A0A7U9DVI0_STRLI|nr:predicted protein [Streptomyces lividans TK24]EOY50819.1 hypothetical protein SLI_6112 [Streptomyces lividans 1326]THA99920.1 hypothetical protein E6R61_01245 [Streptomyces sp. LRa12]
MPVRRGLHGPQSTARVRQRRGAVCGGRRSGPRPRSGTRTGRRNVVVPACFTMWETGLDKTGLDNFNASEHLKGSITWLSAASTSAGPRVSTPAPPPSSSEPPRPQASR